MPISLPNPARACRALPKIAKNADIILAKTKPIFRDATLIAATLHLEFAQTNKPNFSTWTNFAITSGK